MAEWRETYRAVVFPWHCDHFGHMNVRWYAHHFDDAGFHLWTVIGCSQAFMRSCGAHVVVARTTTDFVHEMTAGDLLVIKGGIVGIGNKSVTHRARMYNADTGQLCATLESVEVFFDTESRASAPMPEEIRGRLTANIVSLDDE